MKNKYAAVIIVIIALLCVGFYVYSQNSNTSQSEDSITQEYEDGQNNPDDSSFVEKDDVKKDVPTNSSSDSEKPRIYTTYGHSSETPITENEEALTTCLTSPGVNCKFYLISEGDETTNFSEIKTNSKGIATWNWTSKDIETSGLHQAYAEVEGNASNNETLYIE